MAIMLVVGARLDASTGEFYFLLQNKQFVEMTGEYLAHNGVTFWLLLPDTKIKPKSTLPYTYEEAVETCAEDEIWDLGLGNDSEDF